jgi:dienelactone hydrolase
MSKLNLSPSQLHYRLADHAPRVDSFSKDPEQDVKAWQKRVRKRLWGLLGMDRMPGERCALKPRTLWRQEHPLGVIEKVVFTAEPGSDVMAYVCLPKSAKPLYPTMICLQGHTTGMHHSIGFEREDETKPMVVEGDRDFAIGCMSRGIAALCIEQRAFGLRREQHQKLVMDAGCHDSAMHALMLGRTLAGERVYDVDRGLDYLAWRGDINMQRVGVMGNSGGGVVSIYAAALLKRIYMAMPSCGFCTYADSLMRIRHCSDNFIPGMLQYLEMADVLGLIAPKPVVVVAGKLDGLFPIKRVRSAFKEAAEIYGAAGAGSECKLVVGPEGHRFYAELGWKQALGIMLR